MSAAETPVWAEAAALVIKQGVGLGVLPERTRQLALALAWTGLPDTVMSEPEINVAIKAQLEGAVRCLDTDHVELRRWLVDAGWLSRDGFGRAYRRVPLAALRAEQQVLARPLSETDVAAWAQRLCDEAQRQRERRRRSWLDQQPLRPS